MKIKKIAAVVLAPTAVTGVVLSGWVAVHAATGSPAGRDAHRQALQVKHHQARTAPHRPVRPARHRAGPAHQATAAASPAPQAAAASSPSALTGMSAFEQCVAWRESGDNPTASSAGMFGILPATWASLGYAGTAGQAPVALQKAAFDRLYAQYGTQPWAAYDGC
jgi:hypothetical protein